MRLLTWNIQWGLGMDGRVDLARIVAHARALAAATTGTTVVRVAEELSVDAIVVASHGRTGLERLFLGSVSEHIVRHAHCPVLVVREPK